MFQHHKQFGYREGRKIGSNKSILQIWRRLPVEFTHTVQIILLFFQAFQILFLFVLFDYIRIDS